VIYPFANRTFTGVDIGAYSMKVVSLTGRPGAYTLVNASCIKLPERGPDAASPLADGLLPELIKKERIPGRRVAALMAGPSLIIRHLYLPVMPDKDLSEAVRWEIRKETAIADDDLVADYVLAGDETKTAEKTRSVIAFAARRKEVDDIMAVFSRASLEVRVIEVIPSALLFAFDANNDWGEGVNYSALDIGTSSSTLTIFNNRRLAFTREIDFGGEDITASLVNALGIESHEADDYKSRYGLEDPGEGDAGARDVVSSHIESLCSELQRSFDYYQAQFRGGAISKLFISGGTARLKGIEDFITETIGVPSFTDDPIRGIKTSRKTEKEDLMTIAPCLSIATGLAVRMSTG